MRPESLSRTTKARRQEFSAIANAHSIPDVEGVGIGNAQPSEDWPVWSQLRFPRFENHAWSGAYLTRRQPLGREASAGSLSAIAKLARHQKPCRRADAHIVDNGRPRRIRNRSDRSRMVGT